ncbi:MAG TPA: hypothetical protein VF941_04215, partial [Clostridia bacterium]
MSNEIYEFMRNVEMQAMSIIEEGYKPQGRPYECLFQLLYLPSFEKVESWEMFKQNNNYFIVLSYWNKDEDLKKLEIPHVDLKLRYNKLSVEPTIVSKRKEITEDFANEILNILGTLKISPLPEGCPFGCDGVSFKMKFGGLFHGIKIEWWCDGPENWRDF